MNLNRLRTFVVVAEMGNIGRAAEKLFRTQPAISNQMKGLEEETRLTLFERKSSRVYLTKEGRSLYEFARQRIFEIDDMVIRLRDDSRKLSGVLKLGVLEEFCEHLIPDMVSAFNKKYPQISFDIRYCAHDLLEKKMLNSDIDFALMAVYNDKRFFDIQHYIYSQRKLVVSPELLERFSPVARYGDLLQLPFIALGSRMQALHIWLENNQQKQLLKEVKKIVPVVAVTDANTMIKLCRQGLGACFAYDLMLEDDIESGELIELFPEAEPVGLTIDISRRKVHTPSMLHDTFWRFMLDRSVVSQDVPHE
ncbi:MAG: LysR family transcriptional regulator [Arenicella sp.]